VFNSATKLTGPDGLLGLSLFALAYLL
jgi:hypothetical protein